jgi:hypothetical protein
VWALAALSLAAGLLHASVIGAHEGQGRLPLLFAAAAVAQAAWALLVVGRPTRAVLLVGAALNAAFVGFYVLTRVTGLPIEGLRTAEEVGTKDLLTAAIEVGIVGIVLLLLLPNLGAAMAWRRIPVTVAALLAGALLAMTVPALALGHGSAGHSHGDEAAAEHEHTEGDEHAEGDERTEGDDHAHEGETTTGSVTAEQQAVADALVAETGDALTRWEDVAVAEADGFVTIGDGRGSGYEHFINQEYLASDEILAPEHPESLVYELNDDGTKTLVSAMYILPPGSTMDDVPDVAGELTVWHDHDNLCWNETGQIAGVLVNGRCFPGGEHNGASAPMLHVWVVENPCGPFAGIEGGGASHGASCEHAH